MMNSRQLIQDTLRTSAIAGVATTSAVAACGWRERGDTIGPINAVSHIAWGEKAARRRELSWKYTLTGLALNTAAVASWAVLYELLFGRSFDGRDKKYRDTDQRDMAKALIGGPVVSGVAYVTDYHLVPPRLTPGFEKRLSNRSLLGVYSVLGVALAVGGLGNMLRRRAG